MLNSSCCWDPLYQGVLYKLRILYDEWLDFFDEWNNEKNPALVKPVLTILFSTKMRIMEKLRNNRQKLVTRIYEYQKFIKLNLKFIQALEAEGADTANLRAEIEELEGKIVELKLRGGFSM